MTGEASADAHTDAAAPLDSSGLVAWGSAHAQARIAAFQEKRRSYHAMGFRLVGGCTGVQYAVRHDEVGWHLYVRLNDRDTDAALIRLLCGKNRGWTRYGPYPSFHEIRARMEVACQTPVSKARATSLRKPYKAETGLQLSRGQVAFLDDRHWASGWQDYVADEVAAPLWTQMKPYWALRGNPPAEVLHGFERALKRGWLECP